MSLMVHDLYCAPCEAYESDVVYRRSVGKPKCPDCGAERSIAWLDRAPASPAEWEPIETATGTIETRKQFDKMIADKRAKNPNAEVVVRGNTKPLAKRKAEEARHRSLQSLKNGGFSLSDVKARRKEIRTKKLERTASK